jgi:DNA-binding response OmpR family regulator
MAKILIVEDDRGMALGLSASLTHEDYAVTHVARGDDALERHAELKPDLVLLDVMLPGLNGFEVCRRIRQHDRATPILILTARGDEIDKVMGLDLGADDYLTKPVGVPELLARVRALLRRATAPEPPLPDALSFGSVRVDFVRYVATRGAEPVHLTVKEYGLLRYLAAHEGAAVRRDILIDRVWGEDVFPTNRTVDTHMLSLRSKLEHDPAHPRHLLTVHGVGYKFVREA